MCWVRGLVSNTHNCPHCFQEYLNTSSQARTFESQTAIQGRVNNWDAIFFNFAAKPLTN